MSTFIKQFQFLKSLTKNYKICLVNEKKIHVS